MGDDKGATDATAKDAVTARQMAAGRPTQTTPPIEAVLFDMDGVITNTAEAHAAAWKRVFDEYLQARSNARGATFRLFDIEEDYRQYVDGKPRYDGVESFLSSRGIKLPRGREDDGPDAETICGLGNRKNRYFREWLDHHPIKTFPAAVKLVKDLRDAGVKTAVFSASRNAEWVLRSARVLDLFDAKVDGNDLAKLGVPGKPDPAMVREAASRLSVSPERAAVVEDAIAGVKAGARGGFGLVIGINRGHSGDALKNAGANLVVRGLFELSLNPDTGLTTKTLSNLPLFRDREDELRHRLAGKAPAAFLDYDGTLTPIVEDYTRAFMSDHMRSALAELAKHCTVAVVSGRDAAVMRRLVNLEGIYYAGSHGFEIRGPKAWSDSLDKGAQFLPEIDEAESRLRHRLSKIVGHAVERKRFAIAVHYRRVADADVPQVEAAVDEVLADFRGLRKGHGKKVFRIQPNIDWDKGHAMLWLLDRLKLDRPDVLPIYVGDDITDEDAFRALAGRGLALVVQDRNDPGERPTAADYALADPDDVKRFIQFLTAVLSARSK
ncbi:MAG: trehalose-phosphatase [Pseudolabrys sp.]